MNNDKKDFYGKTCWEFVIMDSIDINQYIVEMDMLLHISRYSKDYVKFQEIAKKNKAWNLEGDFLDQRNGEKKINNL